MSVNRMNRIDEEVKRALAEIIRNDVKDDRLSAMTSVTRVEITSDLKFAKVHISVYDTDKKRNASIDALNHGASFIRTKLARAVDIRRVPELTFVLDDSIEYSIKISKILDDVNSKERE
ncbi:MAG: 30S ribosome-binding factor RbfA [Christensenella sp.]|uniref:30S ribosome-binding factor RbfA n=1 Tax=Christensenella sp. TaxID=1935934 RepID=UPI002B206D2D|nr:30S ribosome-binding factor RbfA [Christensenella sp.]MEA5003752.1 30S ribosome-binding factor RbfA [Christensenella sp.]